MFQWCRIGETCTLDANPFSHLGYGTICILTMPIPGQKSDGTQSETGNEPEPDNEPNDRQGMHVYDPSAINGL